MNETYITVTGPQWSQPKIGWMTRRSSSGLSAAPRPQWSQPKIGWMTRVQALEEELAAEPQWSQPKIGWMTRSPSGPRPGPARRNGASRRSAG